MGARETGGLMEPSNLSVERTRAKAAQAAHFYVGRLHVVLHMQWQSHNFAAYVERESK